ncbi:MAG: SprB repeat-containing protein [Chitinophagaceae bacterium]|nr:SprB repeat-containing protein [Chitinophagaceae bacterium]
MVTLLSYWQSNDASAAVVVSGGNAPYSYNWSTQPPQFSSIVSGLSVGTYYVTVTDSNGCMLLDSVVVGRVTKYYCRT